jgi:hypothetical protein
MLLRVDAAPENGQCQHEGSVSGQRQIKPAELTPLSS